VAGSRREKAKTSSPYAHETRKKHAGVERGGGDASRGGIGVSEKVEIAWTDENSVPSGKP